MKILALSLAALLPCLAAGPDVDKGRTMGNPAAPMLFELYSDFMCPACKNLHENVLPTILLDYVKTGKAYLVFREFPLNIPAHVYSRPAAAFAVAAARIGKYQTVSDALFRSQQAWGMSGKVWETVSPALTPVEQKKVQVLMKDPSIAAEVQHDLEQGMAAHVGGTPTLVMTRKGKQTPWNSWTDYGLFKSMVDLLLSK